MGFTIVGAFAVLNLFIGVIVEAVQEAPREIEMRIKDEVDEVQEEVHGMHVVQEDQASVQRRILEEISSLRAEIASLRAPPATPAE
jgi:hypothetical protein